MTGRKPFHLATKARKGEGHPQDQEDHQRKICLHRILPTTKRRTSPLDQAISFPRATPVEQNLIRVRTGALTPALRGRYNHHHRSRPASAPRRHLELSIHHPIRGCRTIHTLATLPEVSQALVQARQALRQDTRAVSRKSAVRTILSRKISRGLRALILTPIQGLLLLNRKVGDHL